MISNDFNDSEQIKKMLNSYVKRFKMTQNEKWFRMIAKDYKRLQKI